MSEEIVFSSSVLAELSWRGLIKAQTHDELDTKLAEGPLTLYCGFDPTADSLHAGNLLMIIGLAHFRRHGHAPIALAGGATGMIGDPSGKSDEREMISEEIIAANLAGISTQLRTILDRAMTMHADGVETENNAPIPLVNNADWMKPWSFIDFLRDVGKNFSVNQMMSKTSVAERLNNRDQGISYTEFSYMLIQAYDFLHLAREHGCSLQIGGSDQWGNITAGTDLIRRNIQKPAFGLTFPLLTDKNGKKFGKSEGGAIWLDAARTSPYQFFQYWKNLDDVEMPKLLRSFTFLSRERVDELVGVIERKENRGSMVQAELAYQLTWLVHGREEADKAVASAKLLFGGEIRDVSEQDLLAVFANVPSAEVSRAELEQGIPVIDFFVNTGAQKSKSEARRLLKQGGLYINGVSVADDSKVVTLDDLAVGSTMVIRTGKKKHRVVRVND